MGLLALLASSPLATLSAGAVLGQESLRQDDARATATDEAELRRLVKQLAAPEFVQREEATQQLWQRGQAVESLLQQALQSPDREVVARARLILERFRYGIYPDTPQETVLLIERYRTGDSEVRERVVQQLVSAGEVEVIERFVDLADNDEARQQVADWVLTRFDENFAPALQAGQMQEVERLLLVAAHDEQDLAMCAGFLLERDRLDDGIAFLLQKLSRREQEPQADVTRELRLLATLYRAKGDLANTLATLKRLETFDVRMRNELIGARQWQAWSDWEAEQELNTAVEFPLGRDVSESLAFAALAHHLADNEERRAELLNRLREYAEQESAAQVNAAETFFAVDEPEEAIEWLIKGDKMNGFTLLCAQHRYQEAFEVLGMELTDESIDQWYTAQLDPAKLQSQAGLMQLFQLVEISGQLALLGEHELAQSGYRQLADLVLSEQHPNQALLREICRQEFLLDYEELAWEQMERLFRQRRFSENEVMQSEFITRCMLSNNYVMASFWMRVLAKVEQEPIARAKRVRELVELRAVPELENEAQVREAFAESLAAAEEFVEQAVIDRKPLEFALMADSCFEIGLNDLAKRFYRSAFETGDQRAAVKLADLAREEKAFAEAAEWYGRAYEADPQLLAALYLRGHCRQHAGDEVAGQADQELARLLALNTNQALQMADSLLIRGFDEVAIELWRRVTRTSEPLSSAYSDACGRIANAVSESNPPLAAEHWQQVLIGVMKADRNFVNQTSYLNLVELIHHAQAKQLLAEGKVEEAVKHVRLCERYEPGSTRVAEDFVPLLEAADAQAEADRLFENYYQRHQEILQLFPESALHHNNLAWFSARCQRRLDEALKHALRAVELEPDSSNYLDTLAELRFLRGEYAAALELAKRCIKINPDKDHYREQKQRFEQALQAADSES